MRMARRAAAMFDYRTIIVAAGFLVLMLIAFVIYVGAQANRAANERSLGDSRRIDRQATEISDLQHQLAAARRSQGQSDARLAAVDEQVRQLGATPVAVAATAPNVSLRRAPQAKPRATHSPSPTPTASTHRTPHPVPSPTCTHPLGPICLP